MADPSPTSFRCQRCSDAVKQLLCRRDQVESWCAGCSADTKWIALEVQPTGAAAAPVHDPSAHAPPDASVRLLVGGREFQTTVATLLSRDRPNMFCGLFDRAFAMQTEAGAVVVDRPCKWFSVVLDYCRLGDMAESAHLDADALREIRVEADYYCLTGLARLVDDALAKLHANTLDSFFRSVDHIVLLQHDVTERLRALHAEKRNLPPLALAEHAPAAAAVAAVADGVTSLRDSAQYLTHSIEASLAEVGRLFCGAVCPPSTSAPTAAAAAAATSSASLSLSGDAASLLPAGRQEKQKPAPVSDGGRS